MKPELDKLRECEERLSVIEKQKQSSKQEYEETYIHIETLNVEKIDYHLEFGELTIDELSGRLNIAQPIIYRQKRRTKSASENPKHHQHQRSRSVRKGSSSSNPSMFPCLTEGKTGNRIERRGYTWH